MSHLHLSMDPVDEELLHELEAGLDPAMPGASAVPFTVIGYGEMSTVFRIDNDHQVAYKRMPLFKDEESARAYIAMFEEYSRLLAEAGIQVPPQETRIVALPGRPVVLYIAQPLLPFDRFCHTMVHSADAEAAGEIIDAVSREISRVWEWNREHHPHHELSLDGQLSNWVMDGSTGRPYYIDTSTPMYRVNQEEQLDPELFLQSAPWMLRWILRLFFVEDVMTRYYDFRQVLRDLLANLHKEGRADLVPHVVG
ncbi:MAG: hypothetical protein E4H09_02250, partial [Spirochaetales bacterium]